MLSPPAADELASPDMFSNVSELLRQTYVFRRLAPDQLSALAQTFSERHFDPGETIIRRGNHADGWHVIQSGKVLVVAGQRGNRGLRKMFRGENTVDYYDGENT